MALTLDTIKTLVDTYAPVIKLCSATILGISYSEDTRPCSIEWYLQQCDLYNGNTLLLSNPSPNDLVAHNVAGVYLKQRSSTTYTGNLDTAVCYAHVIALPPPGTPGFDSVPDGLDIQYWFFYAYNGKLGFILPMNLTGEHEGDWEHITVRLSNASDPGSRAIAGIFYAAHGAAEGSWLTDQASGTTPVSGKYVLLNETHPLVYAAWHSHASYEDTGLQGRWRTAWMANDVTGDGPQWGGSGKNVLVAVDGVQGVSFAEPAWLNFTGKWGASDESPPSPKQQAPWKAGIYTQLKLLAGAGSQWGNDRAGNGIAFGTIGGTQLAAVTRSGTDGDRVFLFSYGSGTALTQLASTGGDWGGSRYANAVAFGALGSQEVIGVARNGSDNGTLLFYAYDAASKKLNQIAAAGGEWGQGRGATDIAFGTLGGKPVVAATRSEGDHDRLTVYTCDDKYRFTRLIGAGDTLPNSTKGVALTFGALDTRDAIVMITSDITGDRVFLYGYDQATNTLTQLASAGSAWEDGDRATGVAWGVIGAQPVICVTTSPAENFPGWDNRVYLYTYNPTLLRLDLLAATGAGWATGVGATAIAFGSLESQPIIAVTLSANDGAEVVTYRYNAVTRQLEALAMEGYGWGAGRGATAVALGTLNNQLVVGATRTAGDHERVLVFELA